MTKPKTKTKARPRAKAKKPVRLNPFENRSRASGFVKKALFDSIEQDARELTRLEKRLSDLDRREKVGRRKKDKSGYTAIVEAQVQVSASIKKLRADQRTFLMNFAKQKDLLSNLSEGDSAGSTVINFQLGDFEKIQVVLTASAPQDAVAEQDPDLDLGEDDEEPAD